MVKEYQTEYEPMIVETPVQKEVIERRSLKNVALDMPSTQAVVLSIPKDRLNDKLSSSDGEYYRPKNRAVAGRRRFADSSSSEKSLSKSPINRPVTIKQVRKINPIPEESLSNDSCEIVAVNTRRSRRAPARNLSMKSATQSDASLASGSADEKNFVDLT